MRVANIVHGSYCLLGAYSSLSVMGLAHPLLRRHPDRGVTVGVAGLLMQRRFLARFYHRRPKR
jgi:branched-subunit amino acid ABC-type transport system permease component